MELKEFKCINVNVNLDEYLKFYEYVKSQMIFPKWLGDFNKDNINFILKFGGKLWVYYRNDEIVCTMLYIPSSKKSLKKFNLSYDSNVVGECGPIMVNPKYVGNGLQYQMLEVLTKYCCSLNKKIIATTIHPQNQLSINNFLKCGYKYVDSFNFSRGPRNLYTKELNEVLL